MTTTRLLFVYRRQRTERFLLNKHGEGPDEMLYGFNYLQLPKWDSSYIEGDTNERKTIIGFVLRAFDIVFSRIIGIGFALDIAIYNLAKLRKADIIISTVDTCGLPIAFLKKIGVIDRPILYISQGLSDRLDLSVHRGLFHKFVHGFVKSILDSVEKIIVLGEGACTHFQEVFLINSERIATLPFGIDTDFWFPKDLENNHGSQEAYVLSVGNDPGRDFSTLIDAIGNESLKIVTKLKIIPPSNKPNITISSNYSDLELKSLYQGASFVITPLKDIFQPSGQSVTLQAMACGKTVILSETRGLWHKSALKHGHNCLLVPPGDPRAMAQSINYLLNHPDEAYRIGQNAHELVNTMFNSRIFASNLEKILESINS